MGLLKRARMKVRGRRRIAIAGAIAAAGIALALVLVAGSGSGGDAAADTVAQADLPPKPWEAPDTETAPAGANPDIYGKPDPAAVKLKPGEMPPASAGSNGSYEPRPASERERMSALTHADGSPGSSERVAYLLGDTALPPANAPEEIQAAISAANQLITQPYRWGGGHASFQSNGYDCSGAVSYALAGAGLLGAPATSGQLMGWGEPGRGKWLTVYANPGHTYAVIAGLRWDTVGNANGSGPRWHPADAYPSGFVTRHIPGL